LFHTGDLLHCIQEGPQFSGALTALASRADAVCYTHAIPVLMPRGQAAPFNQGPAGLRLPR
jgi:hypothetical protein